MEVFVRLAIDKYIKNNLTKSFLEAVTKMIEDHLEPFMEQFDCHAWRKRLLWNEECDLIYKKNMKLVQKLYQTYSGRYALPGATKYMSLDEFTDMVVSSGVIDDDFGTREIAA